MAAGNGFTPTQRAILNLLSDGLPHRREELTACLPDDLGSFGTVRVHLTYLRKKMPPGEGIIAQYTGGRIVYRWVRFITQGE